MRLPYRRLSWSALLCATVLVAGCGTTVVNPVTGQAERTVMDERAELEEGRKAHQQVLAETPAYANPRLQGYVANLGARLAQSSQRPNLPWTFTVLDSPEINAFALPGGYVYVTRGIMAYLDSEAELAGVMGHEIGHVTARHGAQRATRQQTAGIGVFAAALLGAAVEAAGVGGATELFARGGQTLAAGALASYSREQELQADQLGAAYLVANRYNPQNMVDVIGVLKNQERFAADVARAEGRAAPGGANWLSSHPSNDRRLADIKEIAGRYAAQQAQWADDGRARFLQAIDGVTFGEGRSQGVTRGRQFYHQDLGIALTAPVGWQVVNEADAILLVNGAGDAGLRVVLAPPDAGNTPEAIVRKLLQPADGRFEQRTVNGLVVTRFAGVKRDAKGQVQNLRATIVSGPGGRFYLLGQVGKDAAAVQRAAAGIAEAEASFRPLTAADQAAARPWTLKVVPMPRGGFAELAKRSPLTTQPEGQLRLLNGVYGQAAEPAPGTLVKVVQ